MSNLDNAVAKTLNLVFAEVKEKDTENEKRRRVLTLKANIGKIATIDINEFITNKNIRYSIDTKSESFLRLVESVKKYGILENIIAELRINKNETEYSLLCIAGHRRILAAKQAGNITKIPTLLQSFTHEGDRVGAALAENLNREDLHCLDIADGYKELLSSNWQEADLANHFCRDIRTIKHYLKISLWSKEIKDLVRAHPDKFTTRVIMRQLAYKKFNTTSELKEAINKIINGPQKSKKELTSKKSYKLALNQYLSKQKFLSDLIKDEIKKAFIELKLI